MSEKRCKKGLQEASATHPEALQAAEVPNLPPMLSAFPPVWGGGPSPQAQLQFTAEVHSVLCNIL